MQALICSLFVYTRQYFYRLLHFKSFSYKTARLVTYYFYIAKHIALQEITPEASHRIQ